MNINTTPASNGALCYMYIKLVM